jgi:hypothetical protein
MMDLQVFESSNQVYQNAGKRVNWNQRLSLIKKHFPEIDNTDWDSALNDNEIFARIVRDILKAQQHSVLTREEQSVAGRKKNIDFDEGMSGWRELMGRSYSDYEFTRAFRLLASDRSTGKHHSLSMIANKTNISRSRVHRLMNGIEEPDLRDMEMIASAYKKKPSFFIEYRTSVIIGYLAKKMEADPEITTSIYEMITR